MFLYITAVEYRGGYELRVRFSNGATKDVDLSGELHGEVFEPLRDPAIFRQVAINSETGTIEWPNGADLSPEFLFDVGEEVQNVA